MDNVKTAKEPLTGLKELVETLEANLTQVESEISIFDYYLSGYTTKCGPQQVTGWTKNVDTRYAAGTSNTETACCQFSNNEFTAPVAGFYSICGWLRFKKGG